MGCTQIVQSCALQSKPKCESGPQAKKKKATATEKSPKTKKADGAAATERLDRPTRASARQSRICNKAEQDDDDDKLDYDDLDEDDDSFYGDEMVFTAGQKNRNMKTNASPLTPKSATFFKYTA